MSDRPTSAPAPQNAAAPRNSGRVALALAIVVIAAEAARLLLSNLLFRFVDFAAYQYGIVAAGMAIAVTLLAIVAIVVGVYGARRGAWLRGGIAIGVGAVVVADGVVLSIVLPLLSQLPG